MCAISEPMMFTIAFAAAGRRLPSVMVHFGRPSGVGMRIWVNLRHLLLTGMFLFMNRANKIESGNLLYGFGYNMDMLSYTE